MIKGTSYSTNQLEKRKVITFNLQSKDSWIKGNRITKLEISPSFEKAVMSYRIGEKNCDLRDLKDNTTVQYTNIEDENDSRLRLLGKWNEQIFVFKKNGGREILQFVDVSKGIWETKGKINIIGDQTDRSEVLCSYAKMDENRFIIATNKSFVLASFEKGGVINIQRKIPLGDVIDVGIYLNRSVLKVVPYQSPPDHTILIQSNFGERLTLVDIEQRKTLTKFELESECSLKFVTFDMFENRKKEMMVACSVLFKKLHFLGEDRTPPSKKHRQIRLYKLYTGELIKTVYPFPDYPIDNKSSLLTFGATIVNNRYFSIINALQQFRVFWKYMT